MVRQPVSIDGRNPRNVINFLSHDSRKFQNMSYRDIKTILWNAEKNIYNITWNIYRAMRRFHTPADRCFHIPITSSISNEFPLSEKYVVFWYTNNMCCVGFLYDADRLVIKRPYLVNRYKNQNSKTTLWSKTLNFACWGTFSTPNFKVFVQVSFF